MCVTYEYTYAYTHTKQQQHTQLCHFRYKNAFTLEFSKCVYNTRTNIKICVFFFCLCGLFEWMYFCCCCCCYFAYATHTPCNMNEMSEIYLHLIVNTYGFFFVSFNNIIIIFCVCYLSFWFQPFYLRPQYKTSVIVHTGFYCVFIRALVFIVLFISHLLVRQLSVCQRQCERDRVIHTRKLRWRMSEIENVVI